jgi:SAM-dependent methyltransferase
MARAGKANPDGYVHTRDAKEYQRLRDQARMWEEATAHVLAAVGLGPGMSCLDVGSGPGAVMRLMADRVGLRAGSPVSRSTARSVPRRCKTCAKVAPRSSRSPPIFSKEPAGVPFDLTFCRLLLMHMRDPVAILEKMSAWTKPGGVVVAQEFDFGAISVEPTCPAMGEFNRLFEGVFRAHGRNLRAGRQLPAQFEAAGLGTPDGTDAAVHYLPLAQIANMLIGVYDGLYAAAAELGIADPLRASQFRKDMAEAGADGRYYCLTPVLIAAWKRIG